MNKTVIVCYTFPPFPGIGGRRWAKFAKYLYRNDAEIRIIAAKKGPHDPSTWLSDITEYTGLVDYLPSGYPHILTTVPKNFFERWHYRLALAWQIFTQPKGNYFDHSIQFGKTAAKRVEHFLKLGYQNVIVSCGPFRMSHVILQLKNKYPEVNFVLDFRDPWANNNTSFGFQTISPSRREYEYMLEAETLELADMVISVSDEMNVYFQSRVKDKSPKFITIGNGFDREDFPEKRSEKEPINNGKTRLIFTGTLYNKSEHVFAAFCQTIRGWIQEKNPIIKDVEVDFYGHVPAWFYKYANDINALVRFGGNLDLKAVYNALGQADACLLFLTDDLTYSRSTKFYEYAAMGKPIVVCSIEGETGNYVADKRMGFQCRTENMESDLWHMLDALKQNTFVLSNTADVSNFDVKILAEKIQKALK